MRPRSVSASRTTSNPMTRAVPAVGISSVVSILTIVVLPAPLGPSKPNSSPAATSNERSSTARTSLARRRMTPTVVR